MSDGNFDELVGSLTTQMANLQVQDATRQSKRMDLPAVDVTFEFDNLAAKIMKCERRTHEGRNRQFTGFFGIPAVVQAKLWELLHRYELLPGKFQKKHLLWALHFLKNYPNISVMAATMKTKDDKRTPDEKTIRKWVQKGVDAIASLKEEVILWENRYQNDRGNSQLVGVDTMDCPFQQILIPHKSKPDKMMLNKALYSKKLNGPGVRYEIGTCLLSSDVVWVSGPWLPGDWNDVSIFRQGLKFELEEGERVEADDIYLAEAPEHVVCLASPEVLGDEQKLKFRRRAQARIEVYNEHLKNWKCLSSKFFQRGSPEEKLQKHQSMFYACVVIKQVSMELGFGELWDLGDDFH